MVFVQTLMTGDGGVIEDRKRQARKASKMDLVRREAGSVTDGVVVGERDVQTSDIAVFLAFVDGDRASIWAMVWLTRSVSPLVGE